jgi:subtilisin-like proprotein convertase family protein
MQEATIRVPTSGRLLDIDLAIDIQHPSVCDLQIFLVSPKGTRIYLNQYDVYDFKAFQQNYRWTIFNDEAAAGIENGTAPFEGTFRPKAGALLSTFRDENPFGLWKIQVGDAVYADSGIFKSARLDLIINPEPATVITLCMGFMIVRLFRRAAINKQRLSSRVVFF